MRVVVGVDQPQADPSARGHVPALPPVGSAEYRRAGVKTVHGQRDVRLRRFGAVGVTTRGRYRRHPDGDGRRRLLARGHLRQLRGRTTGGIPRGRRWPTCRALILFGTFARVLATVDYGRLDTGRSWTCGWRSAPPIRYVGECNQGRERSWKVTSLNSVASSSSIA